MNDKQERSIFYHQDNAKTGASSRWWVGILITYLFIQMLIQRLAKAQQVYKAFLEIP
jgi:hypothetical protein